MAVQNGAETTESLKTQVFKPDVYVDDEDPDKMYELQDTLSLTAQKSKVSYTYPIFYEREVASTYRFNNLKPTDYHSEGNRSHSE